MQGGVFTLSHATVFRRLEALENRLGTRLFDRGSSGYSLTSAGEKLAAAAARIEEDVAAAQRLVVGQDLRPEGTVRITTTDTLLAGILTPIFVAFRRQYWRSTLKSPSPTNCLTCPNAKLMLLCARQTGHRKLVGRKFGEIVQAVHRSGPDSTLFYPVLEQWISTNRLNERGCCRVNALMGMRKAMLVGMGLTVLPCYLCDPDTSLVRIGEPIPELAMDLWSLTHPICGRYRAFGPLWTS